MLQQKISDILLWLFCSSLFLKFVKIFQFSSEKRDTIATENKLLRLLWCFVDHFFFLSSSCKISPIVTRRRRQNCIWKTSHIFLCVLISLLHFSCKFLESPFGERDGRNSKISAEEGDRNASKERVILLCIFWCPSF